MDDPAYRAGMALAYLVRRMETFCGVSGSDVVMYQRGDRGGIPERMPAADVVNAQARRYSVHRDLYPEDHREILDRGVTGLLADTDTAARAREGFLHALSEGRLRHM